MQDPVPTSRAVLLTAGLIALAAVTYWPSSQALWHFRASENTTGAHGFLVAPLAAWLLYRNRQRLAAAPLRPSPLAGVLLLGCSVAWPW